MKKTVFHAAILLLAAPLLVSCSLSKNKAEPSGKGLTLERIYSAPSLGGASLKQLKVSPDGQRVTFLKAKETDNNRFDLWEYHVLSTQTRLLVDSDLLHSGHEALSDEEKARRERMRVYGSGIMEYYWSGDGTALLFPLGGDIYHFNLATKEVVKLTDTNEFETDVRFSPKGNYVSYIRSQNLYVKNIRTGVETAITKDGKGTIKNGMAEFVAQEEMDRMTGYWWSPDEKYVAFTQIDESGVQKQIRNEIYADGIKLIEQRYPATGTDNVKIRLAYSHVENPHVRWINLGDEKDFYLPRVKWTADSLGITYQWQSRDQQILKLNQYDINNKQKRELLVERSETWINLHKSLHFLKKTPQFIWASERSGFKHFYLYNNDGTLVRTLTNGSWVVNKLLRVDEKSGYVYFTGRKDSPREQHLYRVPLAGGEVERISNREGFHNIFFAKQGDIYVDNFSSATSLPQVSLHNSNGKLLTWLLKNEVNSAHPYYVYKDQMIEPEYGELSADDGQILLYELYKPKQIPSNQKLPVIIYVYGGPKVGQQVVNSWSRNQFFTQYLVNQGYAVFSLDNRGSYNRGKDFEGVIYKNLGVHEVADQLIGIEFLKTLPYIDSNKVGVYGHSYGGYMAQMMMYKSGEHIAAGVSGAPVTDWLLYDTHYTERYLGHPNENRAGYEASSVFPYVQNLQGPLLIYHGMADDNVLFTNATKVFSVLQKADKQFEMMTYPGAKHSMRGKETKVHMYKTIVNFFDRHLKEKD